MPNWWLWRTKPAPKGPKVVDTFELPWSYVSSPRRSDDWQDLVDVMREQVMPRLRRKGGSHWNRNDRGQMLAVAIQLLGRGGKAFMLTPPIEKFVDISAIYPNFREVSSARPLHLIHPAFWIQPEVFATTGEVYQGASIEQLYPITFAELQEVSQEPGTREAGGFILAALDAYQESGHAKQAFLKPKKTATQLQREIDETLAKKPRRRQTG